MDRMTKIAEKVVANTKRADFGDVTLFLNVFDIFDTPKGSVQDAEVETLKDAIMGEALKSAAWRNMKREVIASLRRDRALMEFMQERDITFKA